MAPGLRKILDLIKTKPTDQRLIDRFLALVNDLGDVERFDATLQLSKILIPKMPAKALELSWSMFKAGNKEHENLQIIAQVLEVLGKSGKAAAIRADADRLTKFKLGSPEQEITRNNIEKTVQSVKGDSKSQFSDSFHTKTGNKAVAIFDLSNAQGNAKPTGVELEATSPRKEPNKKSPLGSLDSNPPPQKKVTKSEISENEFARNSPTKNSVVALSDAAVGAGIPEAIPRKEPSSHSKALFDSMDSRRVDKITVSAKDSAISLKHMAIMDDPASWHDHVKRLLSDKNWDDLLAFLTAVISNRDHAFVIDVMSKEGLLKIDIRFAELWIDALLAGKQERRAFRFMLGALKDEPLMSWAKMVKNRLALVTESLGLDGIDWAESEGVSALRRRMLLVRPRLGVYVVLPTILS